MDSRDGGEPVTKEPIINKLERLEREATPGPEPLSELAVLEAAATPEPWVVLNETEDGAFLAVCHIEPDDPWDVCCTIEHPPDAALIVAMRNALPSLISQLREQRERADELEHHVDALTQDRNLYVQKWTETDLARLAAERTVREQREALERIVARIETETGLDEDDCISTVHRIAIAALAPNTEGEGTND